MLTKCFTGNHHDGFVVRDSGLIECVQDEDHLRRVTNKLCQTGEFGVETWATFFGDSAFGRSEFMRCMWKMVEDDPVKQLANDIMAKVRVCVEWGFGDVYNLWPRLHTTFKQQLFQSLPGIQLHLGFFLANCRNCVSPNQVAQQFKGMRPSLEDYVAATLQEAASINAFAAGGGPFQCECCRA